MTPLDPDSSSLQHRPRSVQVIMLAVMVALLPGTLLYAVLIDGRVLTNIVIACAVGLLVEALCLLLRQRPLLPSLSDGSVILACWLLALCVPPALPLWQLALGAFTLVTLGKHLFGGLGHNPFNPAMVAYTLLLVSFPVTMTHWQTNASAQPSQAHSASVQSGSPADALSLKAVDWDGLTGATVLDRLRAIKRDTAAAAEKAAPGAIGAGPGNPANLTPLRPGTTLILQWIEHSPWKWVSLGWLAGGLLLLVLRIISWHIPVAVLGSMTLLYTLYGVFGSGSVLAVVPMLLTGAIMLGALFIATDPVSAPASRQGQLLYGAGIGLLCVVIREYSAYPEGFAFAVLLMNICVPLMDHLSTGRGGNLISRKSQP